MEVLTPRWTSSSFLLYAGGLTVLFAAAVSLSYLSNNYRHAGFVGWSVLVFAVLGSLAWRFRRSGLRIPAGIFALLAVVAFGVVVGALESWWGWLPKSTTAPFAGFHAGRLLLFVLVFVASVVAIRIFRFPFLVLPAVATAWYVVTDAISGGGNWSAIVTALVGLVFLLVGVSLDRGARRPYGFWLHVGSGLTIGGSVVYFWHRSDGDWAAVAVASLVFVAVAAGAGRSSWAVLAAVGLLLAGGHYALEWSRTAILFVGPSTPGQPREWALGLVFAFVGFLMLALGLLLGRRRSQP